jgi:hypothetical protein
MSAEKWFKNIIKIIELDMGTYLCWILILEAVLG